MAAALVFSGMSPAVADDSVTAETTAEETAAPAEETAPAEEPAAPAEEPAAPAEEPAAPAEEPAAPAEEPAAPAEEPAAPAEEEAAPAEEASVDAPAARVAAPEESEAVVALAAVCAGLNGGFEIDGNYVPGDCGGNKDWTNVAYSSQTQGGTYNTANKDDSDPIAWDKSGSTPPKGDFERVYSYAQTIGANYYLNFGWERNQEAGTGGYLIEVTNAGTRFGPDGAPQPIRTQGGVLFVITTQGGAAPVLRATCVYTSIADYPGTCTPYNGGGGFISAVSNEVLTNPFGEQVLAGEFFEVGMNVTQLTGGVVKPGCPAPSAATAYIRSFTGNIDSTSKNLKGFVDPLTLTPPSTCVPLTATKTATPSYVRDYDWSIDKSVAQSSAKVRPGQNATFDYTVTVTPLAPQDTGHKVTGVITVTNTNPVDVTVTSVTDSIPGATCVINGLATPVVPKNGGTANIAYTCTLPSGTAGTNTATVNWGDTAIPAGSTQATAGFTFAGLAPSATTDASVTVSDTAAAFNGPKTVTKLDGPTVFTYSRSLGSDVAAGECKTYDNTASIAATTDQGKLSDSVQVQVCTGADLTVQKNVMLSLTRTYAWDIEKSVDDTVRTVDENGEATFDYTVKVTPRTPTDSNWVMSGQITVQNPNDWAVAATVTDLPSFAGVECTVAGGIAASIPANSSKVFDYTCTFSGTGPFISGTNKATVTWDANAAYSPTGSAESTVAISAATWNTTPVNATITVIDDKTDPANPVTLGTANWADGPKTFTYSVTIDGTPGECVDYTNTATIYETGQDDEVTVTVCDYADLTVSKTANPTFDRRYAFTIDKSAEETELVIDAETGTATANYTVTVTDGAATDSNFKVSGVITVTNPNAVDVPLDTLTDKIGDTSCALVLPADLEVPADGTLTVNYTCTLPNATSSTSGTNVASVTWDEEELLGTSGTASGSKAFSFANAVITDLNAKTITVLDDKTNPGSEVELGEHTWTANGATEDFEYSLELDGTPGECVEYTNTAWIEQTDQSAEETVEVCAYQDLTVSKTAVGAFDRDYDWSITKDVDQDATTIVPGGSSAFEYTVTATPTAAQDSNFTVTGSITVTNPNDIDITITLVDVLPGGDCDISGIGDLTIEGGSTSVFPYECTLAQATASTSVTNEVDIAWNANLLPGSSGEADAAATVNFAQVTPVTTDATATVSDTADEFGDPVVLNAADGAKVFTYTRDLSTAAGDCTTYPNTATVTPSFESAKSDSASVEVCSPTILKVKESAVQSADPDVWNVSYLITVKLTDGEREYDLGDDPAFAPGVDILSGTAQRIEPTTGTLIEDIPQDGTPFVTDVIGGEGNTEHVYRVTWQVRVPVQIPADERECEGADTGFFNTGILTVGDVVQTSSDCMPIAEKVYPVVRKTVSGLSRDAATKEWTIEYTLEVELAGLGAGNPEGLSSKYNLSDTLDYGVIEVVDAMWSGQGQTDVPFDVDGGVWSADIATGKAIAAGAIHTYVVTVVATLDATDLRTRTVGCTRVGETSGLGFFNKAELSFTDDIAPQVVEACAPPVYADVDKVATGTTVDPETGLQRVSYVVAVTAPGAAATGPVANVLYSLIERPDELPDNVELVGTWHAEPFNVDAPAVTQATWDGTGDWILKDLGVFSSADRSAGKLVHLFRVWADVQVTATAAEAPEPCTDEETEGIALWNTVALVYGEQELEARDCNVVNYDDVSVVKTATNLPEAPEGEEPSVEVGDTFDYVLTVTNTGTRPAEDVVVTDPVPARLEVTGISLPAGWVNDNDPALVDGDNVVSVSIPSLAVGESVEIVISVEFLAPEYVEGAEEPPTAIDELVNEACVEALLDEDPDNNCSEIEIPVREITAVVYTSCVGDAPLLGWSISKSGTLLDDPIEFVWTPDPIEGVSPVPANVTITHPGGTATWSDLIEWPGSAFTPSGVSIDYPGWRQIVASDIVRGSIPTQYYLPGTTDIMTLEQQREFVFNGLILDPSELDYSWRLGSTVTFTVNPTLVFELEYPPASPECFVARHSEVQIEKTASVEKTEPGASFTYDLAVENVSDDSAAEAVVVTDEIPADIKITDVSWPGEDDDAVFPNWETCDVSGQDSGGYGGVLECVLFGPLQPTGLEGAVSAAPTITLAATVSPSSKSSVITNVAVVDYHTFGDPDDPGRDSDDATVTLSQLPATGGGESWPLAVFGLLALIAGATTLLIVRRRRGEVKPTL
ncbi:LPXTG cell wall anchor domain-containing protein [Microbacterium sp. CFBP9034]|uniref:LPXTG cell wall anchor domain-containing protein n=1 Tax=Microbacterium sp. CFBP9034 TaxID=3096540 RepID=UPI002A6AE8BA|nr:LPXTG cell wall anchor domain-containing protein [Microbacterium sp. CFBP9034]MDY0910334.1 LPXTG cell wall anchor domain-containing protein [Microbacterium sp. CFBP9034]